MMRAMIVSALDFFFFSFVFMMLSFLFLNYETAGSIYSLINLKVFEELA